MAGFKPLLAETLEDASKLKFPVLASPKLDGIRAIVYDGKIVSRNLKPIQNDYIRNLLSQPELDGLDGELIVGNPADKNAYRNTASGVMSADGEPDFVFYVFDNARLDRPYTTRLADAAYKVEQWWGDNVIKLLEQKMIFDEAGLNAYEEECLAAGYEGVMVRNPEALYKYGRSTVKEGILLKIKRFKQSEAPITGFVERMHNGNEATTNALGRTERSSHKENMVGRGDLGALQVVDEKGNTFSIGTGFTDEERKEIWDNQDKYLGKLVTCKYMDYGNYDVPRFPVYKGIRDKADL